MPKGMPFADLKRRVLGARYELSLVFIGERRARALNKAHRGKSYVPNVLAFPLTKTSGEVYITPQVARREAKKFDMTERVFILFLFIHALLHLKGYTHGGTMEAIERRLLREFTT